MNNVNKTLYIPLFGKAYVSKKGLFLSDKMAEKIWDAEGFKLKGKSKSKWLAYYMGIRSATFDGWVKEKRSLYDDAVVIHIGCGLDNRCERVGTCGHKWYDVDFPDVIEERRRYYKDADDYKMIASDATSLEWLSDVPEDACAIVVLEGVSMYLSPEKLRSLFQNLAEHFKKVHLLMDCYSVFAARMSKYKNPINDVGVSRVYGIDEPRVAENTKISFVTEHEMTPERFISELSGFEKFIFKKLYAGSFAKKLYRLFEYRKN